MLTNKTFSKESNFRNNAVTKIVMSQKLRTKNPRTNYAQLFQRLII